MELRKKLKICMNFRLVFSDAFTSVLRVNNTHMEELVPYLIQYKNSLKYKVGCF